MKAEFWLHTTFYFNKTASTSGCYSTRKKMRNLFKLLTCVYELLLLLPNRGSMLKVNDTRTVSRLCLQLILKTTETDRPQFRPSVLSNFEQSVNLSKVPCWSSDFVVIIENIQAFNTIRNNHSTLFSNRGLIVTLSDIYDGAFLRK